MTKYLITGARAPVALELARNLHHFGHTVVLGDTFRYPLARNSLAVKQYYQLPPPRYQLAEYTKALQYIIQRESIDKVVPTCEEVFYLSYIKPILSATCEVFCPDFDLIKAVHSKYLIQQYSQSLGIDLPITERVALRDISAVTAFNQVVVKPEFSRFGTYALLNPTPRKVRTLQQFSGFHSDSQFVIQQKIQGQEYCSYAIAVEGKVTASIIYQPTYRLKKAAGIYFKPIENTLIDQFIRNFCVHHQYTGQIGFDFMGTDTRVYLLECNPRATSGLHLLYQHDLSSAFSGSALASKPQVQAATLGAAMSSIGLWQSLLSRRSIRNVKAWYHDKQVARDVIASKQDKSFAKYQCLSLWELTRIALKHRLSLRAASTRDIEWDGESLCD